MIKVSFLSVIALFVIFTDLHAAKVYRSQTISTDTVWEKEVIVEGKLIFDRKATLKIMPGTKILFKKVDEDNDGLSESTIIINGNIIAKGSAEKPIIFSSLADKKDWADWKEIQINHAKGFLFSNCIVEYSEFGFHIHFSEGIINNCIFRKNGDATRLGNSVITFSNNLFENNAGKALNFTNCKLTFRENTVRYNREGLFVFEKVGESVIEHNNIYDNKSNVNTGDFFKGTFSLGKNYVSDVTGIQNNITLENEGKPYLGILPAFTEAYVRKTIETGGFVDGGASEDGKALYFTSFDGSLYIYSPQSDDLKRFFIGEFIDCKPLMFNNYVIVSDWSGNVYAFDKEKNERVWQTSLEKSLFDDHRMPSPLRLNDKILVARPDGKVYLLEALTGKIVKKIVLEDELRATPLITEGHAVVVGCNGTVSLINVKGEIKTIRVEASFYSSPVIYGSYIAVVSKDGKLYFFDKELNVKSLVFLKASFRHQSPVIFNNKLYLFSLDGGVFEVDNHKVTMKKSYDLIFTATPIVVENYIVAPTFSGKLLFFSKKRDFFVENFGEIQFEPYYSDGHIYLGSRSNKLYVIKPW